MQNNASTQPDVVKSRSISPIWFLPFIAAILAIWIIFQNLTHKNVEISIHFTNAASIIVDKTKIRYKGVSVGTVKKIQLDENNGVNVIAEIESHATFLLKQHSKFWLVYPKATLTSISGLDTLFSGSYIKLLPGDGEPATSFTATVEQPISIPDNALLINLKSKSAASINVGTPIFFKKIHVGEIASVKLDKQGEFVSIQAFIEKKYSHLVKANSKFWNISGLNANISRAGIDFSLDSLTTLIAGGITFNSPESSSPLTENKVYELFDNIKEAKQGLNITLKLNNTNNLPKNAGILFKGHGIGRLNNIDYDAEKQQFIAQATINPAYADLVTENATFWVEKTSVSFSKLENLGNIISGDFISFNHSDNYQNEQAQTTFTISENGTSAKDNLLIKLRADQANGLTEGAQVSYKGLTIGKIASINLTSDNQNIEALLSIKDEYAYLITSKSKFHLLSGVNVKASLQGLEVSSTPLQNVIQGGVALYNPPGAAKTDKDSPIKNNSLFYLYPTKEMAKLGKHKFTAPIKLSLLSKEAPTVSAGSPVYYQKLKVGEVNSVKLHDSSLMQTNIQIDPKYKHLINNKTVFWNSSGIQVNAGVSGLEVNADSLLSIAAGGITLGFSNVAVNNKVSSGQYRLFDNKTQATQPVQQISLIFDNAYDLKVGNKVKLKGLDIGEISQLSLDNQNNVIVTLDINNQYFDKIAKQGTRFWIVRSEISLSGTKNLSTLISGVYLNTEPGNGQKTTRFKGESAAPTLALEQQGLTVVLLADNAGSTDVASPVYHRQIQIGEVTEKRLQKDADGVEILLNIYPEYTHLIRKNSIFWPASGFNLDIGITGIALTSTSLTSLVKGGISMSTPDDEKLQPASKNNAVYSLKTEMDDDWLQWKLKIPHNN